MFSGASSFQILLIVVPLAPLLIAGACLIYIAVQGKPTPAQAAERKRRYHQMLAEERRRTQRQQVSLSAVAVFKDRAEEIACTVLDISKSGARLAFAQPVEFPQELELNIAKENRRVKARVVWSNGATCGVAFLGTA